MVRAVTGQREDHDHRTAHARDLLDPHLIGERGRHLLVGNRGRPIRCHYRRGDAQLADQPVDVDLDDAPIEARIILGGGVQGNAILFREFARDRAGAQLAGSCGGGPHIRAVVASALAH